MAQTKTHNLKSSLQRFTIVAQAAVLAAATMLPLLLSGNASAAMLANRKVTINDSVISQTGVQYDFEFDFASSAVQGIVFEFCTAPLGTCTLPTGMNVNRTLTTIDGDTGFNAGSNIFSEFATDNTGECTDIDGSSDDTQYCVTATNATPAAGTNVTVDLGAITNPSSVQTVYIRVRLYSDASFATRVHEGTVAAAIVDQLTVNGRVQERLEFCVAGVDDADAMPADVATCTALTDSNVDIGIIDESSIAISPVTTTATNGSDDDYGILMVNTNAQGGVVLAYYAEDPTSVSSGDTHQLKSFRVVPADCDATASVVSDQCFISAVNTGSGSVLTTGTELFGMYIPCVVQNTGGSTTANLTSVATAYNGSDDTITTAADCENETFTSATGTVAWNTAGTADTLISSSTVVDDEIVKLRFAATASATTPPGSYTVVTTYIATGTF